MKDNTLIVIGAGLAGLSAGCYAQMNGYQCHIFEHHSQPGGVAAAWKRKDYLIDGGIHFIMGHKPGTGLYELYRQLGIVPDVRFTDLTTYGRFVDEASGLSLEVTADLDRLAHDLSVLFPDDRALTGDLVKGARAMSRFDMSEFGMSKPPELSSLFDQLREMWGMRPLLTYFTGKYSQPVAQYVRGVHDPRLRAVIESLFMPDVPVYFVLMVLGLVAAGQIGLIEGGCHDFVGALERRFLALGGEITYNAAVEKIIIERHSLAGRGNDAVAGVRLADGREERAAAVISAADGYSTIYKMLDGNYLNQRIERRYATWKTFRPLLMASFGVDRSFPNDVPFTTIVLERPLVIGPQTIDRLFVRLFNYSGRFAPPGKSVIQVEFETEWDHWYNLQRENRAAYDAEKERVASEILARLERHYPGITSQVEVEDVATPYTTWRYTLNHKGAWEGWLLTPEIFNTTIERTLPGLDNFYMAGQWVMPGGGVPPCLYSGRHAVQMLCRRDGKAFIVSVP